MALEIRPVSDPLQTDGVHPPPHHHHKKTWSLHRGINQLIKGKTIRTLMQTKCTELQHFLQDAGAIHCFESIWQSLSICWTYGLTQSV